MHSETAMATPQSPRALGFQPEKGIAAIGYLVEHTSAGLYSLLKMMYLADRLHLWRFGRLISGDTYSAMKQGPVPSATYDLLKHVRGEPRRVPGAELAARVFGYEEEHRVVLKQRPDYDELSASDIECLDEVVNLLHRHGSRAIRDMSHDGAWEDCRGRLGIFRKTCNMSIEDMAKQSDDAESLLAHLQDPQPGSA